MNATENHEPAKPLAVPLSDLLGPLLDDWADAAGTCFVYRDDGTHVYQVTYGSIKRDDLLQLMRAVQAAEREHVRIPASAAEARKRWRTTHQR